MYHIHIKQVNNSTKTSHQNTNKKATKFENMFVKFCIDCGHLNSIKCL